MTDSLGYRRKFGVIAPSTNTSVQAEFDSMRPVGVTNHFSRIVIPDNPVRNDDDFNKLMNDIRKTLMDSVDAVMTCSPDYIVMGMSAETFWDGLDGSVELQQRVEARAGVKVAMGSDACRAALKAYGGIKRISVITPYMPVGDQQVRKFFADCGFEVVNLKGLKCPGPMLIAHVSEAELLGLATAPSETVAVPRLADAPVAMECRLSSSAGRGLATLGCEPRPPWTMAGLKRGRA